MSRSLSRPGPGDEPIQALETGRTIGPEILRFPPGPHLLEQAADLGAGGHAAREQVAARQREARHLARPELCEQRLESRARRVSGGRGQTQQIGRQGRAVTVEEPAHAVPVQVEPRQRGPDEAREPLGVAPRQPQPQGDAPGLPRPGAGEQRR